MPLSRIVVSVTRTLAAPSTKMPVAGRLAIRQFSTVSAAPVAITKSVSILAVPGVVGSVLATGGDAIVIATAAVKVALRNLVIVPFPGGGGTNGINMTNGASLTVENCLIANLPIAGIYVNTPAIVRVTDTTIRDNGSYGLALQNGAHGRVTRDTISRNGSAGIIVFSTAASPVTMADIADSTVDGNANGVWALSTFVSSVVRVSVRDSRLVQDGTYGAIAQSTAGATVTLSVTNNIVSNNFNGITASGAGSAVAASGNTISDNDTAIFNSGGLFQSTGNNVTANNISLNSNGTITVITTR
jgi:hypothetical protein